MRANQHPQQAERLATLHRYEILDTPRESDFDDIVALASRICKAPISVINLIDRERQWFKAEVGLNARETPLETSLCAHAILDSDFVEIPDTLLDRRLSDNPLCASENGVRFYAGALLVAPNGLPIGTLCILDTQPRSLTPLQRETLRILSRQIMVQLELRLALRNQHVLAREVDHRVKNSLQSVASVVRLYRRAAAGSENAEGFAAIERRIEAVSALHRELLGSPDGGNVALDTYLDRILDLLRAAAPDNVTLQGSFDTGILSSHRAAALAVIISEFAANAIKHAFPGGRAGVIDMRLRRTAPGRLELTCTDDGIGNASVKPDKAPPSTAESLGLGLMSAAASELGTKVQTELTAQGSRLVLAFSDLAVSG